MLSLIVFAELSNVTDGWTDIIGVAIVDLMLRATRWHRSQKVSMVISRPIIALIDSKRLVLSQTQDVSKKPAH